MRFSQAMEYGIVGLMELAKNQEEMSLADIAKNARVPESFLAKIFQRLHKAKIIESRRGKGGGFFFPPEKKEVTLWEVHEAIEGPVSVQACVGESEKSCECHKMYHCLLQEVWREVQGSMEQVLRKWTIDDLIKN